MPEIAERRKAPLHSSLRAKATRGVSRVKFNSFTTDERIKIAMRVRRDDESEVERISNCKESVREN